tara:strand:- start:2705 stop:3670 length:966 start_codon:yes stop_codon:yes gene_type:complete
MKKGILIALTFTFFSISYGQDSNILDGKPIEREKFEGVDGAYKKDIRDGDRDRKEQHYHHVREADVMWSTKIWRVIDMREKMNQIFYYPSEPISDRKSLIHVIMDAINLNLNSENGDEGLDAYGPLSFPDDEFGTKLVKEEIARIGKEGSLELLCADYDGVVRNDTCFYYDDEMDAEVFLSNVDDFFEFNTAKVHKWRVKEEWYFDKQRSVMDVRIIGLCPMMERKDENNRISYKPLFWVYYPEARKFLKNAEIFNHRKNDAARMTYDDVFHKRFFHSYIYKESNKYDRNISQYKAGIDALLEAEQIKEEIFNLEHDLWEY